MLSPASRTSSNSFFVATVIKKLAGAENGLAKIRITNGPFGYQIGRTAEQFLQGLSKSEVVVGVFTGGLLFESHQKIQVAALRVEFVRGSRNEAASIFIGPSLISDASLSRSADHETAIR